MKQVLFFGLMALLCAACSEEAQPYEEINTTFTTEINRGRIQTH